ncbi:EF-hand domain-containing protein [Streptomyces sp. NPDC088725]|uniref:EF-hand domain-containing protein n=1 Tax=Streptomyces sp. NPDC088725 TaxID=3365873 RepID=UPI00380898D4
MRTEALNRSTLVFNLFDANNNGYLDPDDFELMAKRVNQAVPQAEDAAKSAMLAGFRGYWAALVRELDTNRDGRISLAEYNACVLCPERFEGALTEFAESISALGDLDGDGFVSRPVFDAIMTAVGFRHANIHALFDALEPSDTDHIRRATWAEAIKEYYGPDKAGIPGDYLVEVPAA